MFATQPNGDFRAPATACELVPNGAAQDGLALVRHDLVTQWRGFPADSE
jgi:hypothetical protein